MLTERQLYALVGVIAVLWYGSLLISGSTPGLSFFQPVSGLPVAVAVVFWYFDRVMWRWSLFQHTLVQRPDIRGTWRVQLTPDTSDESVRVIEAYLVIRQTYSSLSIRLFTAESQSESFVAQISRADDGQYKVFSVYRNEPTMSRRAASPIHNGTLILDVLGEEPNGLRCRYWTDRRTLGEGNSTGRANNLAQSFEGGQAIFGS